MLSNTGGYAKQSHVLGRRRDDTTLRSTLCPMMRARGFCRAHMRETSIRIRVAAEKEEELRRSATELLSLQEEVLNNGVVAGDEARRSAAVQKIVEELKREKTYESWSLDAAVEERMVALRVRRCNYSHHREVLAAISHKKLEISGGKKGEKRFKCISDAKERLRVFNDFSPLQKCVACLLWQGSFNAPQKVVRDVRRCAYEIGFINSYEATAVDIEAEEERVVTVTTCRPSLGVVDLSSITHIVAYISKEPDNSVIHPETVAYFTGGGDLCIPSNMTEKELDLSSSACAHELVETIVWTLFLINAEAREKESEGEQVLLRCFSIRRCDITNADALINALRKYKLDATLLALDMGDNRLLSLRFLFILRAHFSNHLLRLSLENNPITRKPEYREQVRRSLPKLTSLDGIAIRRPPLSLPYPLSLSQTFIAASQIPRGRHELSVSELEAVTDALARFMYVWETRRVPWTEDELKFQENQYRRHQQQHPLLNKKQKSEPTEECEEMKEKAAYLPPPEEALDDVNFHHRYLHPSATFSMTVDENLVFFAPDVMRLSTEVELEDGYVGMRLSPLDLRDLRVFDVSMKKNSRNLLLGRSVLHRSARGSLNCYTAYKYSIYPQRLTVCHNLSGAVMSVAKITDTTTDNVDIVSLNATEELTTCGERQKNNKEKKKNTNEKKKKKLGKELQSKTNCSLLILSSKKKAATTTTLSAATPFGVGARARKPVFYVVTIHGVMSWRAPSMRGSECVKAAYDRVITFVENALPPTNQLEKRRSAPLLVFNDNLHLRPATTDRLACVAARAAGRVARMVIECGLDACPDGERFVRAVVERSTSDAAAVAALRVLVHGANSTKDDKEGQEDYGEECEGVREGGDYFDVFSLLAVVDAASHGGEGTGGNVSDEAVPRRVTLAQLDATVAAMNRKHTTFFFFGGGGGVCR